jgi:hypothetical protein
LQSLLLINYYPDFVKPKYLLKINFQNFLLNNWLKSKIAIHPEVLLSILFVHNIHLHFEEHHIEQQQFQPF